VTKNGVIDYDCILTTSMILHLCQSGASDTFAAI